MNLSLLNIYLTAGLGIIGLLINNKLKDLQDVVELNSGLLFDNKKPFILIQNVGSRSIYLDSYTFNGTSYQLNGHILASTYSQAQANYYQVELPVNRERHVSMTINYRDASKRRWKSEIVADFHADWIYGWKVSSFPKKRIKLLSRF